MRAGFVIPSDEECEVRRSASAAVIFVEVAYGSIFLRHGHAVEIIRVADCLILSKIPPRKLSVLGADLEITANDQKIDAGPAIDLR